MFSKRYQERIRIITRDLVGKTLAQTGITPNMVTVLGTLLTIGAVWLLATGQLFAGGLVVAFTSAFDMLDGALARAKNQMSTFGSFLDSTLDRCSETLILLGLLLYYQHALPGSIEIVLIYCAITGSLLISYVRARAEALNYDCKVGILERPERIVLIVLGLITGFPSIMLWVLAIMTYVTVVQRMWHVYMQSRTQAAKEQSSSTV